MGKTIKQLAEEIGVSKQAVFKKIKSEPLSTNLQGLTSTVDGRLTVSVDGEKLIKSAFAKNDRQPVDGLVDGLVDDSLTKLTAIINILQATIDTLQGQLEIKDEQLRNNDEQIKTLQEQLSSKDEQITQLTIAVQQQTAALTASQALHAADKKTLMQIEEENSNRKLSFWERRAAKKARKRSDEQ